MGKATILIVEDEPIVAQDIQNNLTAMGFDVCGQARTGEEAVELARDHLPDLVLMDIRLNGRMDGIQAAACIRGELDLPIVFLTAYLDESTLAQAKVSEPFGYLVKPFREKELQSTIEIALYKHRMQRKLAESEARYRRLVENAPALIFRLALPRRRFEYVSPLAERLSGYPAQAFLDDPDLLRSIVHPVGLSTFDRHWEKSLIEESSGYCDYPIIHHVGTIRWWRQRNIPIRDPAGNRIAVEGLIMDITDEKQRQQEFETIISTSLDGFWIVDVPRASLLEVNDAYCRMSGYSREELVGRPIALVEALETPEEVTRHMGQLSEKGQDRFESRHRHKDGRIFDVEVSVTFMPLTEKCYVFLRDLTARNRLIRDLQQQALHLQELTLRSSEIAEEERRAISRELHDQTGQQFTVLGLNLNMLENSLPPDTPGTVRDRLRDSIDLVDQTAQQLRSLVTQFRPPALDDFGLLAALYGVAGPFEKRTGISVEIQGKEIAPRPRGLVETNLFRIAQEALNNAAKYAQAGRVCIKLYAVGRRLFMSISDDGVGFNPNHPERNGREGRLGLISMGERALALGGTCRIESEPGRGTVVQVEVPL